MLITVVSLEALAEPPPGRIPTGQEVHAELKQSWLKPLVPFVAVDEKSAVEILAKAKLPKPTEPGIYVRRYVVNQPLKAIDLLFLTSIDETEIPDANTFASWSLQSTIGREYSFHLLTLDKKLKAAPPWDPLTKTIPIFTTLSFGHALTQELKDSSTGEVYKRVDQRANGEMMTLSLGGVTPFALEVRHPKGGGSPRLILDGTLLSKEKIGTKEIEFRISKKAPVLKIDPKSVQYDAKLKAEVFTIDISDRPDIHDAILAYPDDPDCTVRFVGEKRSIDKRVSADALSAAFAVVNVYYQDRYGE